MRKSVLFITLLFAISMAANAQKFALIDTKRNRQLFLLHKKQRKRMKS